MLVRDKQSEIFRLLNRFYEKVAGRAPVEAEVVDSDEVPEPYHHLLVHEGDMTSRLTKHYGESISLRILQRSLSASELSRHLVLEGIRSHRPMEYGAIRIYFDGLPHRVREKIIEGRDPLGGLLNEHGVKYVSRPAAFIRVIANEPMQRAFGLRAPVSLYGRCNRLVDSAGRSIAEVVEILPPQLDADEERSKS
jgi:hypothetical protein